MSKSKGNVVDPLELLEKFHPEVIKYFLVSQISIGNDGTFDETLLKNIYNADLANNYGNLLSRTIAMVKQSFADSIVKYRPEKLEELDKQIYQNLEKTVKDYTTLFDEFKIDKAFKTLIQFSSELNAYIDQTTPWLLKDNLPRLEVVLNTLLNGLYALTTLLSPVMPNKAKQALKQLNIATLEVELISDYQKFDKVAIIKAPPLFERLK